MIKIIKQWLCRHECIETKTESSSPEHVFIIKTIIQCMRCDKTFAQHPNAICCYVQHVQSNIMQDYWINKFRNTRQ